VFIDYMKQYKLKKNTTEIKNRNVVEANLCKQLLNSLAKLNYDLNEVAILTPYKEQEKYLLERFEDFQNIYTIDKAQGMEKDVIIISLVKTEGVCALLKDKPRVNVAFTRSKVKLIIVGLYANIIQVDTIKNFIQRIKQESRLIELAEDI
jgi:DNA replication ATP-dependent helicase Dna2